MPPKSDATIAMEDVKNRFAFHPATETTGPQHDAVRADAGRLAQKWQKTLPPGRHKSLALTALQEAMMWANASVACDQPAASSDVPAPQPEPKPTKAAPAKKSTRRVTRRAKT